MLILILVRVLVLVFIPEFASCSIWQLIVAFSPVPEMYTVLWVVDNGGTCQSISYIRFVAIMIA